MAEEQQSKRKCKLNRWREAKKLRKDGGRGGKNILEKENDVFCENLK